MPALIDGSPTSLGHHLGYYGLRLLLLLLLLGRIDGGLHGIAESAAVEAGLLMLGLLLIVTTVGVEVFDSLGGRPHLLVVLLPLLAGRFI
jgi:hypothetical protein